MWPKSIIDENRLILRLQEVMIDRAEMRPSKV